MCVLKMRSWWINVDLSRGSREQGLKHAPKPYHAEGNDEKYFWSKVFEHTLRNKVVNIKNIK